MSIVLEETNEKIRLSDIGLVAALETKGFVPIEKQQQGKQIIFVYDYSPDILDIKEKYFNNNLPVDAYKYSTTLRAIKKAIYLANA